MGKDSKAFLSALVTRELIPGYAGVIREHVTKGEATPRVYVHQFDLIVKRLHRRHRRDLQAIGCGSFIKFADRIYEVFEEELDRLLQRIENEVDTYAFFEHQEEWMLKQQCQEDDHNLLWQSNIDKYGLCLVKSAVWKNRVAEAAEYVMRNGSSSQRTSRDEIRRWLPGLAYEDLVGRTGPGHPTRRPATPIETHTFAKAPQ